VDESDVELRNRTYRHFVETGRAPTASDLGLPEPELDAAWRRLHEAHALVLSPATNEIRMLNPFSLVPTAYRVHAGGRWWYANCAWDAVGICAALHVDGRIDASCADCGGPIALEIAGEVPDDQSLLFHCLVPAVRWWDDIIFT
jgi:hypothetical protein